MAEYYIVTIVTLLSVVYAYKLKPTITLCKSWYKCSLKQVLVCMVDPRIPWNLSLTDKNHQIKFLDGLEGPYTANTSPPPLMCDNSKRITHH